MSTTRKPTRSQRRIFSPTRAALRRDGARHALRAVSKGRNASVGDVVSIRAVLPYSPYQFCEGWLRQWRNIHLATLASAIRYLIHVHPRRISHFAIALLCFSIISTSTHSASQRTSSPQTPVVQQSTSETVVYQPLIGGDILPVAPLPLEPAAVSNSTPLAPVLTTIRPDAS